MNYSQQLEGEPSLESIEDYNGNESKEKRNTVYAVIVFTLIVGAIYTYFKATSVVNDELKVDKKERLYHK